MYKISFQVWKSVLGIYYIYVFGDTVSINSGYFSTPPQLVDFL